VKSSIHENYHYYTYAIILQPLKHGNETQQFYYFMKYSLDLIRAPSAFRLRKIHQSSVQCCYLHHTILYVKNKLRYLENLSEYKISETVGIILK